MTGRASSLPAIVFTLLVIRCAEAQDSQATPSPRFADWKTLQLQLTARTGGQVTGAMLDYNDHGVVVLSQNVPFVFAWSELDAASALQAKRILLEQERGGMARFTAADHFALGQFALDSGRNDLAANEFDRAKKLDRSLEPKIKAAFSDFRRRSEEWTKQQNGEDALAAQPKVDADQPDPPAAMNFDVLPQPSEQVREAVREAYLRFGEKVRDVLGRDLVLVESDHFLIWTDWGPKERVRLTQWVESMYASLCERFGLPVEEDIFLAKCPVFCFRSKARFTRFARDFDGYDAKGAIGYTRSIEKNGHVHMAFARMGSSPADYDRFACTLVHEGTHAFLHRVFAFRLLPHWVNEGYAELTAERVLGDRCPAGENAALLGRQYARFDWPVAALLEQVVSIDVHQYPLAHSVVAYLDERSPQGLVHFIRDLKQGADLSTALAKNFDGLTLDGLEEAWKQSFRAPPSSLDGNSGPGGVEQD